VCPDHVGDTLLDATDGSVSELPASRVDGADGSKQDTIARYVGGAAL
jgi:hypothetical protein